MPRLTVEIDGASRGNPGKAGAGYIISLNGEEIERGKRSLGTTTNNVAEYQAMILGLERASKLGANDISVKTDSLLVLKQIKGDYRVRKKHLKPLTRRCLDLLEGFDSVEMSHVSSDQNRAHELAEEAALEN